MMKRCWHYLQVMVVVLSLCATAHAAQLNFLPELFVSEEYTDNLFLDFDDDAKVDDYITTAGVNLRSEILGRTTGLELIYSPSYSSFADTEDLDFWRHFANLRIWNDFKRNTRLELTGIYLETEDPRDQSDEIDGDAGDTAPSITADNTRRGRNRYRQSTNTLRLSHQYGERSSLYGELGYSLFEDIDLPAGTQRDNNNNLQPGAGFEHWFSQQWGMAVDAYYSNRTYDDRDDRTESFGSIRVLRSFSRRLSGFVEYRHTILDFDEEVADEDYQLYAPSAGITYQLGETTDLSVGAGYYIQDFNESDDEEGFIVNSDIVHTINFQTGQARLSAGSGYEVEDTGAQDLGLQLFYRADVNLDYNFTNKLTGNLNAGYRYDDYLNETPERVDQTFNGGCGLGYQAFRWMRLQLAYDYQDVTSDIETEEYTENSIIFTITVAPSTPYRLN